MTNQLTHLTAALADRYSIERELGAGGMATVYLAQDLRHERRVAVKVLRSDLAASLGPERFHREIRVAAALQHPHIVPLYDSGDAAGHLYYVMPFVEGESLRQKLQREGELPVAEAVRILRDVADALTAAHRRGVVHRDLKPENIMISGRHALVTDFGVAKAVSEATGRENLTTLGVAIGTPTYMAPEQAMADPNIDHRADIYAFGVVAYELLVGRPPFVGSSPQQLVAAHISQVAEPVTNQRPAVPAALATLVMRCLEKRPADRWQSAEELIPPLEAVLTPSGGITPAATVPAKAVPSRREVLRLRSAIIAAGVTVALVASYAAWKFVPRATTSPPSNANRIAVAWLENETGDTSIADIGALATDWIIDGLAKENVGTIVPASYVRELMTELKDSTGRAQALARRSTASLMITGTYRRRGDSLEFRAEIVEFPAGKLFATVGPIAGAATETAALDALFQQVAVALHQRREGRADDVGWYRPSNLAAYREYMRARDEFTRSDWRGSIPGTLRAHELDTMWTAPLFRLSNAYANLGELARADSVLNVVRRIARTERDRNDLDWSISSHVGDYEAMYRAGQRNVALDSGLVYDLALPASRTGRFREVLALAARRDTNVWARNWRPWDTRILTAQHHLGLHEDELLTARRNVTTRGFDLETALWEVRALAALGRRREIDSILARTFEMPPGDGQTPGSVASTAGLELLTHGHPEFAAPVFTRELAWYQARAPEERARRAPAIATVLFNLGRYDDARAIFDSLHRANPQDLVPLGYVGVIAALQGNAARASDIDAQFAAMKDPYIRGEHTVWRSRIASLQGDCPRAVELLQSAFAQGQSHDNYTHHWWAHVGKARECKGLRDALESRD